MRSDLLLDGPRGDGLIERPFDGAFEPGVAGEADLLGSGVDAFYEVVGDAERDLLHADTVSLLTSDIESDIIIGMTNTAPVVGSKVRAETNTRAGVSVVIEVTKLEYEVESGWFVYGYRQYKNRRNGVRQTMFPRLYFVPKAQT